MEKSSKIMQIIGLLGELIIGILLLVNPVGLTSMIICFFGIILLILGICSIVRYFQTEPFAAAAEQSLTKGLLESVFALFCIFKSYWFISTFPILTVIYGIGMLFVGVSKIQLTVDLIRLKIKKWIWAALSAVLMILCAVIILCNPFTSTAVLWTFIAISLIVEAIVDIIVVIFAKKDDVIDVD